MATPEEPLDPLAPRTGRHLLGPHVVGQRVVVRRLLPGLSGPTGGPAMTDLLGICTAWDPEARTCTVQPETGPAVDIDLDDIVSGKPVPPRPSMRHRIEPVDAQRRAMALFPQGQHRPLGDWTLRWSDADPARRANSVLAMTPSGLGVDPAAEVAQVVAAYAGLGRRPIAAVLRDSAQEAAFLAAGWTPESRDADTVFQLTSVAMAMRTPAARREDARVELTDSPDGVMTTATVGDGEATGIAVLDRDWVGFRGVEVAPDHRRRGLGGAVMAALLEWGAEQGASTAYLQVIGDNTPALTMYAALGFVPHHAYRYLAAA